MRDPVDRSIGFAMGRIRIPVLETVDLFDVKNSVGFQEESVVVNLVARGVGLGLPRPNMQRNLMLFRESCICEVSRLDRI